MSARCRSIRGAIDTIRWRMSRIRLRISCKILTDARFLRRPSIRLRGIVRQHVGAGGGQALALARCLLEQDEALPENERIEQDRARARLLRRQARVAVE